MIYVNDFNYYIIIIITYSLISVKQTSYQPATKGRNVI